MQEDQNTIYQKRFPQKLWYLLNTCSDAIMWGGTGRTILLNYRILRVYLQCDTSVFKTTNISSFVRQLNLYGFRKVTSHLQDPLCNSSNPYMHEYVHDYFQFGRPELLNKITRKALPMKKHPKSKSPYGNVEQFLYTTPLQKARRALHIALRKAAQNLFLQNCFKREFHCEDTPHDCCEDENVEFNWIVSENDKNNAEKQLNETDIVPGVVAEISINEDIHNYGITSQDSLISFNNDPCQQTNDNFSSQFLNIPELDSEPNVDNSGVELLAEFNIEHEIDQGITRKTGGMQNDYSLNCVLPSISNDQNDFASMTEKNDVADHYNDGEWDQMLNDIMINKGSNQECGSDMKELYSQISRTIDLLNY